jgi:mevalonate kinase
MDPVQKKMSHRNSKLTIKIPSKTFLTGEYAVLSGHSALVMTHKPYFTCSLIDEKLDEDDDCSNSISFHKDSPAGRLEVELSGSQHKWSFSDPHLGAGGFGGSTAEFIAVYKILRPDGSLNDLCERYFKLFKKNKTPPSGADLVAQFNAKPSFHIYTKNPLSTSCHSWPFFDVEILTLKTDLKLATHKHLDKLGDLNFSELGEISQKVIASFLESNLKDFIEKVQNFSNVQSELGLLSRETESIAELIGSIEGVLAVRGCGAMGADVITVFVNKESMDYVWEQIKLLNKRLKKITT